ncbi:MAG: hypothetical protein ACOYJ2_05015 [Rickettsiales bacterium]
MKKAAIKNSVFKYFSQKPNLDNFLKNGEVFFNTLSYFLSCEDPIRRDEIEDSNVFKPVNGLQITLTDSQQQLVDHRGWISKIPNAHRVFVFCTSLELSEKLSQKFGSVGCVEIFDIEEFNRRLKKRIRNPAHNIKNQEFLSGKVDYYNLVLESGPRHACPDQIIMSKIERFSDEKEYRIAFAKDANAFAVNNVNYYLANSPIPSTKVGTPKKLILGDLTDIARVVM